MTKVVLQHGGSILSSTILRRTFRRISQLWDNTHTLNVENCLLYSSSTISQFLGFMHCMVFDFIFYCVTMHKLFCFQYFLLSNRAILWWSGFAQVILQTGRYEWQFLDKEIPSYLTRELHITIHLENRYRTNCREVNRENEVKKHWLTDVQQHRPNS